MSLTVIMVAALAAIAVGGVAYAFLFDSIESEKKAERRLAGIKNAETSGSTKRGRRDRADEAGNRRKAVADSLEKLDEKNKDRNAAILNPPMDTRLVQAGMSISLPKFYMLSAVLGLVAALVALVFGAPIYVVPGAAFVAGLGLPRLWVNRVRATRMKQYLAEFPNSLDVIVRAIKSGLPVNDAIRLIASEAKEPVRSEFQRLVENQQMGMATADAINKMYERVPLQEVNFFGIVIAIQSKAGGNLSEALGNLSAVLRARKQMREKVKSLSMEAKASGAIIGALPFVVAGIVTFMDPTFLLPLIERPTGNILLAVATFLMLTGGFIMKKMCTFEV